MGSYGLLMEGHKQTGIYEITWNADNVASGVYYYKLDADRYTAVRKLMLLR